MKKRILSLVVCLAMGMSLTACGGEKGDITKNSDKVNGSDKIEIAFVSKSDSVYWKSMFEYAKKSADENGASIELLFPENDKDIEGQAQIVRNCITDGVNGIIIGASDKDVLAKPISEARKADIPVVLVDSGISGTDYDAFFSTNNILAGAECAKTMCEFIGDSGEVVIINANKGAQTTDERSQGFRDEITKNHPNVTVVEESFCEGDKETAKQQTADLIAKYPNLKGLFGASTSASIGLINGVKQAGSADKVIITFDNADEVKAGLADGSVSATAMQMPSTMATSAVQSIIDLNKGKSIKSKNVDTGVVMITKDNYDNADMAAILNQ